MDRDTSLKWTEDVRLPDGRVVTLTRYQEFKGPHELGETPSASDYWFEFKHPDTGETVRWQSDRDLATLALMIDDKTPVLLTRPHFGSSMIRYHCPNPPYLLYHFDTDSKWSQLPLDKIPVKRIRVNMTFSPDDSATTIKASRHHLSTHQTSESFHNQQPYIINFVLMKRQTFDSANCDRSRDYLIEAWRPQ
jgi:hypothetical protein